MQLSSYDSAPFQARRAALARALGTQAALIASGRPSPRNYPGNPYPFRASSHFLYLFGYPLRDAWAVYDGKDWSLFAPIPAPSNALWLGPEPSLGELSESFGCPVHPLGELADALEGKSAATVAAADPATQKRQSEFLGRLIQPGTFESADGQLADALVALRLIHDAHAIGELRVAAEATRAAHLAGMHATRPGRRESEIRAAMEAEITARDMPVAYGSIVSVHGEVLHNEHHHNYLREGDLLLADVGAESPGGFAGDVTRTWPVTGAFSSTQRALYEVVLAAQKDTVAMVKPGVNYRDIHLNAMTRIAEGLVDIGLLKGQAAELVDVGAVSVFFPHGIGHLLGLDVHDMEDLGDRAGYSPGRQRSKSFGLRSLRLDRVLQPGMAVTIEPGFYQVPAILEHEELGQSADVKRMIDWQRLKDFADVRGIRIEDDVLVTMEGQDVLSAGIPKEPADVENEVGRAA